MYIVTIVMLGITYFVLRCQGQRSFRGALILSKLVARAKSTCSHSSAGLLPFGSFAGLDNVAHNSRRQVHLQRLGFVNIEHSSSMSFRC